MIQLKSHGSFNNLEKWLNKMSGRTYLNALDRAGQLGVQALSSATPKDSGTTADSWTYLIDKGPDTTTLSWSNTNINEGVNIAIILQFGHGTGTGGYVRGRDYINPAIKPIFDAIANDVWKEVTSK